MATAYGCRCQTHPQEHPHACPANCGQIRPRHSSAAPSVASRRLPGAIRLAAGRLPRPIVPPPRPQLADLDIAEWPALLRLRAATRPARLATAGRQRIGHRLGVASGSAALGRSFHTTASSPEDPACRCWFECCRIGADFPRPARLAPWWGQAPRGPAGARPGSGRPAPSWAGRVAVLPVLPCVRCCSGGHTGIPAAGSGSAGTRLPCVGRSTMAPSTSSAWRRSPVLRSSRSRRPAGRVSQPS